MKKKPAQRKAKGAARIQVKGATRKKGVVRIRIPWKPLLSTVAGIGVLMLVGWGGSHLLDLLDQPIKVVRIAGDVKHLNLRTIEKQIQQKVDTGLLSTDLESIKAQLGDRPWVEKVAVRRKWPNILRVDLVERSPVVRWNERALMTADAHVFTPTEGINGFNLPVLIGNDESRRELLDQYHWLARQFEEEGLTLSRLEKEHRGAWQAVLAEGPRLYLGRFSNSTAGRDRLVKKMERFKYLYREKLQQRIAEIERVDLRYTHGISVRWKVSKVEQNSSGRTAEKTVNKINGFSSIT